MDKVQQEHIAGYLAKDDREAGDYEALSYLDEQTASRALTEAEEFVGKVEAFLGQRDG